MNMNDKSLQSCDLIRRIPMSPRNWNAQRFKPRNESLNRFGVELIGKLKREEGRMRKSKSKRDIKKL